MIPLIEENVKWITKCIDYLTKHHIDSIEPTINAQNDWMDHVELTASQTLYATSNSWYNGSNIPGKPRVFMPYVGGFYNYLKMCERVTINDYKNFFLLKQSSP
jgi:cyclohexanone monooxygenase